LILIGIISLCMQSSATWQPDEFVIGAYHEPCYTGILGTDTITFQNYRNIGFNILSGNVLEQDDYWYWYFSQGNTGALYRLFVLTHISGLRTFINGGPNFRQGSTTYARNLCTLATKIPGIPPHTSSYTQNKRDKMYGYCGFPDEASFDAVVRPNVLPVIRTIDSLDPAKPSCPNFACSFAPRSNIYSIDLVNFNTRIAAYLDDASTSLFSFDYYKFSWYFALDGTKLTAVTGGVPTPTFYGHLKVLAEETQKRNKLYYGVPCCANTIVREYNRSDTASTAWVPFTVRKFLNPTNASNPVTESFLRHEANSYILYGAKGLLWFSFHPESTDIKPWNDSPYNGLYGARECYPASDQVANNPALQTSLQKINMEISRLGPTLLGLTWVTVRHGASTDPVIEEPYLPTIFDSTPPPFYHSSPHNPIEPAPSVTGWKPDSMAVGIFKRNNFYYLAIMNKSLTNSNISKFYCVGKSYPRVFDKTNGRWKILKKAAYDKSKNYTSFELDQAIAPGDLQLVWLGPADMMPTINYLLNDSI
jgi:hypothetical protein